MPELSPAHPLLGALAAGKPEAFAELYDMLALSRTETRMLLAGPFIRSSAKKYFARIAGVV